MITARICLLLLPLSLVLQSPAYAETQFFTIPSIPNYEEIPSYDQYQQFIRETLGALDIQVEFKPTPTMRDLDIVQRGEMDATMLDNPKRRPESEEVISTSFPILIVKYKIISRKKDISFSTKHLDQHQGATVLNWYLLKPEMISRQLKYIETASVQQNIKMLLAERVDYVIAAEAIAEDALDLIPLAQEQLRINEATFAEIPVYFTVNKKHKKLFTKIEEVFKSRLAGSLDKYPRLKKSFNSIKTQESSKSTTKSAPTQI